jgi:predicted RNA-binding protein YlxR (DUF448 family)
LTATSAPANRQRLRFCKRGGSSGLRHQQSQLASGPVRTCVGCRQAESRDKLVRMVLVPGGKVTFDLSGGMSGRGAWVHPSLKCVRASPRGLSRAFRAPLGVSAADLQIILNQKACNHAANLGRAAYRAGQLALGVDAGAAAWANGHMALAVVTRDLQNMASAKWIREAFEAGRAITGSPESGFGGWSGKESVGVVAILNERLGKAYARAIQIAQLPEPALCSREPAERTEVG